MGNHAAEANFNRIEHIVDDYPAAAEKVQLTRVEVEAFVRDAKANTDLNFVQNLGLNKNKINKIVDEIMGGASEVSLKTMIEKADQFLEQGKGIEIGISNDMARRLTDQLENAGAVVDGRVHSVSLEGKDVAERALTQEQVELVAAQMTDDEAQQQEIIDLAGNFKEIRTAGSDSDDGDVQTEKITPMDLAKAGAATLGMEYDGQSLGTEAYKQVAYFELADQVKNQELTKETAEQLANQVIEARADRAGLVGEDRDEAVAAAKEAATDLINGDELNFDSQVTTEDFLTKLNEAMPGSLPGSKATDIYDISVDVGAVVESVVQDAERMSIVLSGEQAKADAIDAAIEALQVDEQLSNAEKQIIKSNVAAYFADVAGDPKNPDDDVIKTPTVGEVFDKVQEIAADPTKLGADANIGGSLLEQFKTELDIASIPEGSAKSALEDSLVEIKTDLNKGAIRTVDDLVDRVNVAVTTYNNGKEEEQQLEQVSWAAQDVEIEKDLSSSYAKQLDDWAEENEAEKKKSDLASIATAVGEIFGIDAKVINVLIELAENLLGDDFDRIFNFGSDRDDPDRVPPDPNKIYVRELNELKQEVSYLADTKEQRLDKWGLKQENLNELEGKIAELDLALRSGQVEQAAKLANTLQTDLDDYLPDAAAEQKTRVGNLKEALEERISFVREVTAERGAETSMVQAAAAEQVERDLKPKFDKHVSNIQQQIQKADTKEEKEPYLEALSTMNQLNSLGAIEVAAAEQLLNDIAKGKEVEDNLQTLRLMLNDDVKTNVQEVELAAGSAVKEAVQLSLEKGDEQVVMNLDEVQVSGEDNTMAVTADENGNLEQTVQVTITDASGKEEQIIFDGDNTLEQMNATLDGYYHHTGNTKDISRDNISVEVLSENANDPEYKDLDNQFENRADAAKNDIDNELFDVIGSMVSWVTNDTTVAEADVTENRTATVAGAGSREEQIAAR